MPTAGFRSGKLGRATFNSNILRITRWKVDPKADKLDFTNTEGGGFAEYGGGSLSGGVREVDWEFDFDYYVGQSGNPIFSIITPGEYVTNVIFYIGDPGDGANWTLPIAAVIDSNLESRVRGKVSGTLRGCSNGTFTKPTS